MHLITCARAPGPVVAARRAVRRGLARHPEVGQGGRGLPARAPLRRGSTVLLAHKRYRPRRPRAASCASSASEGDPLPPRLHVPGGVVPVEPGPAGGRATRPITATRSSRRMWPVQEMTMLSVAWASGASVPYPVERKRRRRRHGVHRRREAAAPRLAQAQLSAEESHRPGSSSCEPARPTSAGVVHADLSAYNLLWWHGRLVLIDLPQAVEFTTNPMPPSSSTATSRTSPAGSSERRGGGRRGDFAELLALAW